jgi:hypothetical protein
MFLKYAIRFVLSCKRWYAFAPIYLLLRVLFIRCLKAECSQTHTHALHSQTLKNLCRKLSFKKQSGVVYGSGVNFNTGYITMYLFNFEVISMRLNVIFYRMLQIIVIDTWFAWSLIWYLVLNNDSKTQSIDILRHCGTAENCAPCQRLCAFGANFPRETTKRGPQVRGLPSWTWSMDYLRGPRTSGPLSWTTCETPDFGGLNSWLCMEKCARVEFRHCYHCGNFTQNVKF